MNNTHRITSLALIFSVCLGLSLVPSQAAAQDSSEQDYRNTSWVHRRAAAAYERVAGITEQMRQQGSVPNTGSSSSSSSGSGSSSSSSGSSSSSSTRSTR